MFGPIAMSKLRHSPRLVASALLLAAASLPISCLAAKPAKPAAAADTAATRIVATVNGDVISNDDVESRTRLFALSSGLPMSREVLDRLKPQIIRQLVDERLRLQEVQRRKIVVADKQIANAMREVEERNRMPEGALRAKLIADGVSLRTLIDQIRAQLGWMLVLREQLGEKTQITDAEIAEQERLLAAETGKPEYRVGEIFIAVEDPANTADAQRFAETVIGQLRAGAPFPVVAAQFSQNQTALDGGELGWIQPNQLDPEVAHIVSQMPVGAISNPVKVPGGFSIVMLQAKREIGRDIGTLVTLRQTFLPFTSPLNAQAPTEQQKQTLDKARQLSASVHSCDQMEAASKAANSPRPANPGEIRLESVNPPAFRQMLATLPTDRATQPLVDGEGIAVLIVCSREQKNLAETNKQGIQNRLLADRVELLSRQMQRTLRRQAAIDIRGANGA